MAKKQTVTYLKVETFEDNWCPFHGHFSTFAQTKIPTKMDSKSLNFRAFEGLCSKYSQFQKYLKTLKESFKWWAILDSNQRPPQCQCDALPTAPTAHLSRQSKPCGFEMRYHPLATILNRCSAECQPPI